MHRTRKLWQAARTTCWKLEDLLRGGLARPWGSPAATPIPPEDRLADLEILAQPGTLARGEVFRLRVRLANPGPHTWSSRGPHGLFLRAIWTTWDAKATGHESRAPLPGILRSGKEVLVRVPLTAPDTLGDFTIGIDLVEAGHPFTGGSSIPCRVTGRPREDIDYLRWYARQNLARDYWTVVGPTTRAEYERLADLKLQHLVSVGLRPGHRVLDVGCGTGQLAAALEGFLEGGTYCGVDIAPEAVAFCRSRFRRPGFLFAESGMTSLPVAGPFNCVAFFSVFTHTFPDETAALLREARRVLAAGGMIFADVFTSPRVRECAGNRGAVEWNAEGFLARVAECGLRAEQILLHPGKPGGDRRFFKLW